MTRKDAVVVFGLMLLCGAASLALGPDLNVDLQIYHFYNGWAFLTGRPLGWDIVPASVRTFFNPVMDGLHYWGMSHLPAKVFGFLLGAIHGLNPGIVYLIARRLFRDSAAAPIAAGLFAATGPAALVLLGTCTGDSLATIPILAAVLLVCSPVTRPRVAGAALLVGMATGLKLTMGPYALALGLALILTAPGVRAAAAFAATFGAGGATGYLVTGGFFSLRLWRMFRNPVFPFANGFFKSPFFPAVRWPNDMPRAETLWDFVSPPLQMAMGHTARLQEFFAFRDARLLVLAGLALLTLARPSRLAALDRRERGLLIFVALAYALWLELFYYYRYLVLVEFLVPVVLYVLLRVALPDQWQRHRTPAYFLLLVALTLFARPAPRGLGRGATWADGWIDVQLPRLAQMPRAIVLTDMHISYVFPSFPADDRFCLIHHGAGMEWANDAIARAVAEHTGPVLYFQPIGDRQLAPLGLRDAGVCEPLRTARGHFRICLAERVR